MGVHAYIQWAHYVCASWDEVRARVHARGHTQRVSERRVCVRAVHGALSLTLTRPPPQQQPHTQQQEAKEGRWCGRLRCWRHCRQAFECLRCSSYSVLLPDLKLNFFSLDRQPASPPRRRHQPFLHPLHLLLSWCFSHFLLLYPLLFPPSPLHPLLPGLHYFSCSFSHPLPFPLPSLPLLHPLVHLLPCDFLLPLRCHLSPHLPPLLLPLLPRLHPLLPCLLFLLLPPHPCHLSPHPHLLLSLLCLLLHLPPPFLLPPPLCLLHPLLHFHFPHHFPLLLLLLPSSFHHCVFLDPKFLL
ncbi:hypothetical protein ECC02_010994 [Trypanosoma cruzi]|uniref:Uncharacterized protein n=1 Tax=Trypanosoma cruzi TaxID=5693 RepID=A0A7J6XQI8_TRYCR|nr:hypothetical protein ECC02_010994 [Trypanosoma cruzi]